MSSQCFLYKCTCDLNLVFIHTLFWSQWQCFAIAYWIYISSFSHLSSLIISHMYFLQSYNEECYTMQHMRYDIILSSTFCFPLLQLISLVTLARQGADTGQQNLIQCMKHKFYRCGLCFCPTRINPTKRDEASQR